MKTFYWLDFLESLGGQFGSTVSANTNSHSQNKEPKKR